MKIAFLGTPDFAVPSLDALYRAGHTLALFTQPDRPVGRKAILTPPPAKRYALGHGIPVFQFERIKAPEGVEALRAFAPDLMVTAAFGQMLSPEDLAVPPLGCVNVHGSLLPKYRGAAPIQWAIVNGETRTGVTTMMTDAGMDTGDMLLKAETDILPDETAGELSERLSVLGAELLLRTLSAIESGTLTRVPQDAAEATKCSLIRKEHARLDFSASAKSVHDRVRGFNPWPVAWSTLDGSPVKLYRTRLTGRTADLPAGTLAGSGREGLFVACGDEFLEVLEIQAPGGKRLDGRTFLLGSRAAGARLV